MAEEWQPAPAEKPAEVEKPEAVETPEDDASPQMSAFIKETADLFDEMRKPKPEAKPEEKPEAKPEERPRILESAVPKSHDEDTGFIPDLAKATPEELKKRIDYLYGKDKNNERLWKDAQDFMRKQTGETERLRAELAKREIKHSEAELDAMQARIVDLLNPQSPNYDHKEGTQLLRELTHRDEELKQAKTAEEKRGEEFKTEQEKGQSEQKLAETAQIFNDTFQDRPYAQEGHPMYPHVVEWLRRAYNEAPEHVTVMQIAKRGQQIFDEYAKKGAGTPPAGNGKDTGQPARAPGAGERLTVSQVIGTPQRGQQAPSSPGEKLSAREREVAVKLFYNPEGGVTREKAYSLYSEGKD